MSAASMSLEHALRERRSVRGFTDQPVDPALMEEIFSLAHLAPSNCNVQPWRVFVASGDVRDEMRRRMVEKATNGVMVNPDFEHMPSFAGVYRERQVACAAELYGNMGIARDDRMGRMKATLRNFELFDAPHVAFIGMEKTFGVTVALDVGMYIQSLMLTMTAYGISSCAQGSMRYYPDDVREMFAEPETTGILCGISFGYEDAEVAANKTRVGRSAMTDNATFLSSLP